MQKKKYDYIIVDTAPVNMVTDTLLLGHHANLFIYVVRAEFLDKRMLKVPQMMFEKPAIRMGSRVSCSCSPNGKNIRRRR